MTPEHYEAERNAAPRAIAGDAAFDRDFKPVGAMAFFIILIILGGIIWYGIYFLMLHRA